MDRSPRPSAIVFDLDNTLVHSRIDFRGIRMEIARLLDTVGLLDEPVQLEGPGRKSIGELIRVAEAHDTALGTRLGPRMWAIVERFEREGMRLAEVEPHSVPTLAELRRRGHPTAVLTNNSRRSALEALRKFEMQPYVDPILARDDVPMLKPDPGGLLLACRILARSGEETVMVGDSYQDALAARGAGVPFVAFRPKPGELEPYSLQPLAVIDDLAELLGIL